MCRELRLAASRACLPQFTHCHYSSVASSCLLSIHTKAPSENCCTFCCTQHWKLRKSKIYILIFSSFTSSVLATMTEHRRRPQFHTANNKDTRSRITGYRQISKYSSRSMVIFIFCLGFESFMRIFWKFDKISAKEIRKIHFHFFSFCSLKVTSFFLLSHYVWCWLNLRLEGENFLRPQHHQQQQQSRESEKRKPQKEPVYVFSWIFKIPSLIFN